MTLLRLRPLVIGLAFASGLILAAQTSTPAFVWLEAESAKTTFKVDIGGWGRPQFLSGGNWLHISVEEGRVARKVPDEGILRSHPLFHLHASVAGIRPASPGFRIVRIAPQPGNLPRIASRTPHPDGFIVARGSFVATASIHELVPGFPVKAVDTTGAGDVFNGALTVALGEGKFLRDAVRFANAAAAISVTRLGAQNRPRRIERQSKRF